MEDNRIVEMFLERSEEAIGETQKKYGSYCYSIAFNILSDRLDAEECVNDTYLKAWNSIPPHIPEKLSAFLGKITRNIALNRYAYNRAEKRAPIAEAVYEELCELIPDENGDSPDGGLLRDAINGFLESLPKRTRIIFVQRYWYLCPIKDIARGQGMRESNVKVTLMRTRKKFKEHLEKEGISI